MKDKRFCRCCLSKECYKDMTNTYYIGNKTENYVDMLLNTFNVDVSLLSFIGLGHGTYLAETMGQWVVIADEIIHDKK